VRRNRPLLVSDAASQPRLQQAMITAARTRSYTGTHRRPGAAIGFLHADCYVQRRHPDSADRDLLWVFSDGLGQLLSRAVVMEALHTLRGELQRLATPSSSSGSSNAWVLGGTDNAPACRPVTSAPRGGSCADPGPEFLREVEGVLTPRELEVMRLMGAGLTNAQIARRLMISEGTVKTHVKHILRKLQVANRAEAVSRWLREHSIDRHGRGVPACPTNGQLSTSIRQHR
jgi:DNA-binding CsgD family transcriptional regulator